jgi:aminoglycoside phosphotransferase (APT) family kinase protein
VTHVTESSGRDRLAAVRAYAAAAMGWPVEGVAVGAPFEGGNRHAVYRVAFRGASHGIQDVVVRVSLGGDDAELPYAEREAAVLAHVGGVAGPELYDFRRTSGWFDAPAMCMQFVPGRRRDLRTVDLAEIGRLASLVAWVHARPIDCLPASMGAAGTIAAYAEGRLRAILATLAWARDPLPVTIQERLRSAAGSLARRLETSRGSGGFDSGEPLSLLHGDIGPGNVLWNPGPCLIDWEYTRLGDPADEMAYTFDQNALTPSRRRAFWDGYRHPWPDRVRERVAWWEPVTLLGSALWWVERWVRRTELAATGTADPGVPREADYYFGHVVSRVDRLGALVTP